MPAGLAGRRYLQRHIEPGLPQSPQPAAAWRHVLVLPAYREASTLLPRLQRLPAGSEQALVILVLNRPDWDPDLDANSDLREAVLALPAGSCDGVRGLNSQADLYLLDLDTLAGPLQAAQGVGLARKYGCDLAFKWMCEGAISGRWVCSTDADATLPPDYFHKLDSLSPHAAAATFPFWHAPGDDESCNLATALYELRLHHYVRGLEYAGSPYAYHTLGSCLAVSFEGYAQVRGFPKRSGAEDFYLLNKIAKTGPVTRLAGECIELASRHSQRVPFGTGPAVARISGAAMPQALALFYHPTCYAALRGVLAAAAQLAQQAQADLPTLLAAQGIEGPLQQACSNTLDAMGLAAALDHCRRQGKSPEQFLRQFNEWFDGFRSLRFIHCIRDAGWPNCSLAELHALRPGLWPPASGDTVAELRHSVRQRWGWTLRQE